MMEIKLVDSFVLNKLGEGHGESRLYLGGKTSNNDIKDIFNLQKPSSQLLRLSKKNICKVLNFFESFYLNPKSFYLNNGKLISFKQPLKKIYIQNLQLLDSSANEIIERAELLDADKAGRRYLRVSEKSLLRKLFLPHSTKVILKKYHDGISHFIDCEFKPELKPVKKTIKVKNINHIVEFDYLNNYDF